MCVYVCVSECVCVCMCVCECVWVNVCVVWHVYVCVLWCVYVYVCYGDMKVRSDSKFFESVLLQHTCTLYLYTYRYTVHVSGVLENLL